MATVRSDPDPRIVAARRRLFGNSIGMIVLLAIQNVAGTILNLYVTVNDTASYNGVYPAMVSSVAGIAHTIVGIFLGVGTIFGFVIAGRVGDRTTRWIAALPPIFVALAAYMGYHFVLAGGDSAYSLGMEISFLGVLLSEVVLLLRTMQLPGALPAGRSAPAA